MWIYRFVNTSKVAVKVSDNVEESVKSYSVELVSILSPFSTKLRRDVSLEWHQAILFFGGFHFSLAKPYF